MYLKKIAALFALVFSAALFGCHSDGGDNPRIYPPATPDNLSVQDGSGSLLITWNFADDVESYGVYISELENGDYKPVQTVLTPTVTLTGLTNGTTYWIKVNASNLGGTSPLSEAVSGTPGPYDILPDVPAYLTAQAGDGKAVLSWPSAPGAESYNIYMSQDGGVTFTPLYNVTGLTYTVTGLINGDTYIFAVTALNEQGESGMAQSVEVTPASPDTAPAAPKGLALTAGDGKITLSWQAEGDAESYIVYEGPAQSGDFTPIGTTDSTTYTVTGLTNGTVYWFTVAGANKIGAGTQAAPRQGTPAKPSAAPGRVTGIELTAGDGSVYLKWQPAPGAETYNIYHSISETGPFALIGSTAALNYEASGLENGVTHWFKVTAVNDAGESVTPVTVFASTQAPSAPRTPAAVNITALDGGASVSWPPVFGAVSYNVYMGTSETGPFTKVAPASASPYKAEGLTNGTEYWFTVTAVNGAGESAPGTPAKVTPAVPAKAPAAPSGLTAAVQNGSIALSWTAVTGASWYNVYMSQSESGLYMKIRSAQTNSETVTGLEATGQLWFKVSAENGGGESPMSAPAAVTID